MAQSANVIEIRVDTISALFNTLDPYPFRQRDMDRNAEEFIVGWAREQSRDGPITLIVHLPADELNHPQAGLVPRAITNYFGERMEAVTLELRELFRVGRLSLGVGLLVLAACLVVGRFIPTSMNLGYLNRFVSEGLIILGWVANWRPIEIFLYDWWPLVRRRNLFGRLADARVELRAVDKI
jgi:hypothetical protein